MVFYPREPDFDSLIGSCCGGSGDAEFQEFRSAWHPYLEAALALVDGSVSERLHERIYEDYKTIFQSGHNRALDYETYLLAVAFSRLAEERGDGSLRYLLERTFGRTVWRASERRDLYIWTFSAILRMPDGCTSVLLSACFPRRVGAWVFPRLLGRGGDVLDGVPAGCVEALDRVLAPVVR